MDEKKIFSFIHNPIINITGLACRLWSDTDKDKLRNRLKWKVAMHSLTPEEKKIIIDELRELLNDAEQELNNH